MNTNNYRLLVHSYLKAGDFWQEFTKTVQKQVETHFSGAVSNLQKHASRYQFNFIFFGVDCEVKLQTNGKSFMLSYELMVDDDDKEGNIYHREISDARLRFVFEVGSLKRVIDLQETEEQFSIKNAFALFDLLLEELEVSYLVSDSSK